MESLKLIYKSFYDNEFIKNYVRNGKSDGKGSYAWLALFLIMYFIITIGFAAYSNKDSFRQQIIEAMERLPKLVVIDGKLDYPDNVVKRIDLGDDIFVTIDTLNENPTIADLRNSTFYITRASVFFYNKNDGKLKDVNFKDLQRVSGKNPLDLTSIDTVNFAMFIAKCIFILMIALFLTVGFVVAWLVNCLWAFVVRNIGKVFVKDLKTMEFMEAKRLTAASVIPALILMNIISHGFVSLSFFVRVLLVLVLGIALIKANMKKIYKED